jgi:hypothetical protein
MSELPTIEYVPVQKGRQLVWRVCGLGYCVEEFSIPRAWAKFEALCRSKGLEPPSAGPDQPRRGPSEVDEPGV